MTLTPVIRSTQTGPGAATGSRRDLVTGASVLCEDISGNVGATYVWTLLSRPFDSAVEFDDTEIAAPTLSALDATDTYLVKCEATIGGETASAMVFLRVPLSNGVCVPAFGEKFEDGGYFEDISRVMRLSAEAVDLSEVESDIADLDTRLDTAESAITTLDGRLDTAESDIDDLETEVGGFDTRIDDAEADILDIQIIAEHYRLAPPGSPHSIDDDFTTDTSANWSKTTSFSGTVDPLSINSSGNPKLDVGTLQHGCWTVQPRDATEFVMTKAVTLDTNCAIYFEGSVGDNSAAYSGTNFGNLALALTANPTNLLGHYILLYLDGNSGGKVALFDRNMTAGYAVTASISTASFRGSYYVRGAIQKISNVYHGVLFAPSGAPIHMGSFTYSGNVLGNVGLYMYCDSTVHTRLFRLNKFRYYPNQIKFPV